MQNLNLRLSFATLIPDFIYQFFSNELIDQKIFTCFELEDIRNSIKNLEFEELKKMKKFLMINNKKKEKLLQPETIIDILDEELKEIDNEYYHRYTPEELKYIFKEIIMNIDIIYNAFKKELDINPILTIDFKFKNGLESSMVIEFLGKDDIPSSLENVLFLPMENYMVSDDIITRLYFHINPQYSDKYKYFFDKIMDIMNLKSPNNLN